MRIKPKFSLRLMLVLTTFLAVLFAISAYQIRKQQGIQRTQAKFREKGVYVELNARGEVRSASFAPFRAAGQPLASIDKRPRAQVKVILDVATLENISFVGSRCFDTDVAAIESKSLKWIDLSNTQITDGALTSLSKMKTLTHLYLSDTGITDNGVRALSHLSGLKELSLMQTNISDSSITFLTGLSELEYLDLRGNALTDQSLLLLKPLSKLRSLHLNGERLDNTGRSLDLVQLSNKGLASLATMHKLEQLELSNCGLSDDSLKYLGGLPSLNSLVLSRNHAITDAGLQHLKSLKNLRQLFISSPQITQTGVSDLKISLPKCQINWQY